MAISSVQLASGWRKGEGWLAATDEPASNTNYTPAFTGRGWYVDANNGSDSNPGTSALPWKTLKRAATATLASGDALLLKCGGVWRESLEVSPSFAPAGNVLIGAYGDCAGDRRPVVRASDWVNTAGWVKVSNTSDGVHAKPYGGDIKRLFIDGKPLLQARYPNYKGVGAEFAIATGVGTSNSFKISPPDQKAIDSQNLIGATVHVRCADWRVDTAIVTGFNPVTSVITLDRNLSQPIITGAGYILEGKRWMLDTSGEWFLDQANRKLYLWAPAGVSPATLQGVEASWRPFGLSVHGLNKVRIERIRFEQQSDLSVKLTNTPGAIVSDIVSLHGAEYGIAASVAENLVIDKSTVAGAGRISINVTESPRTRISNNTVTDTGFMGRAAGTDSAISIEGANSVVEGNVVERSANLGIRFKNLPGTFIRNNTVLSSCSRLSDCAGIYTYTAPYPAPAPKSYVAGATLQGNIIIGSKGNLDGIGLLGANQAAGIYLDELSSGVSISGNIISDTELGISIHNGSYNTVSNNQVRGSSYAAFRGVMSRTDADVMRGNQLKNNSFFTHSALERSVFNGLPAQGARSVAQFWFHADAPAQFFSGSNPNIVSGNEDLSVQQLGSVGWKLISAKTGGTIVEENAWRTYAPSDRQGTPIVYRAAAPVSEGANILDNGDFSKASTTAAASTASNWSSYFSPTGIGGAFKMLATDDPTCGQASCGLLSVSTASDYLLSPKFQLNTASGQNLYRLKYTTTGASSNSGVDRTTIRRFASPYETYGLNVTGKTLGTGQKYVSDTYFYATGGSDAVIDFRGVVGGQTMLSNVSVTKVSDIEYLKLSTLAIHVINAKAGNVSYSCSLIGLNTCDLVDETGAPVSWPLTLAGRTSKMLFARDPKWMQQY